MAPGVADVGATQTETPHEAALQLIEALRNRKAEPKKLAKGSQKAEGKGSSAADKPTKKDDSRPACPKEGQKVFYKGATIRLKGDKLCLRVPRLLTKDARKAWTVERVIGSDKKGFRECARQA